MYQFKVGTFRTIESQRHSNHSHAATLKLHQLGIIMSSLQLYHLTCIFSCSTSVFTTPPTKDKMISHHFPTDLRPLKPHAHLGRTSDLHVTKDIQSSPSHIPGTFASDVTVCQQWMLQPSQVVLTTPSYGEFSHSRQPRQFGSRMVEVLQKKLFQFGWVSATSLLMFFSFLENHNILFK